MAGGRPPKLSGQELNEIKKLIENGVSIFKVAEQYGVNHSTIYYQLGRLKRKPVLKREEKTRKRKQYYYKKPAQEEKSELSYSEILEKQNKIKIVRDKQTGEALKVINI